MNNSPLSLIRMFSGMAFALWHTRGGAEWVIDGVERRYGSFYLHGCHLEYPRRAARRVNYYWLVVGALPTPVRIPAKEINSATKEIESKYGCVLLTTIPAAKSTPEDVYRRVRRWRALSDETSEMRRRRMKSLDATPVQGERDERMKALTEKSSQEENERAARRNPIVDQAIKEFETAYPRRGTEGAGGQVSPPPTA